MISPEGIKQKALRWWHDGSFLRSIISGEPFFPKDISQIGLVSNREKTTEFLKISHEQKFLLEASKEFSGRGYSLEWEERNHRHIGINRFIRRIYFETEQDFLSFTGTAKKLAIFKKDVNLILAELPALKDYLTRDPLLVVEHQGKWEDIIDVCQYFLNRHRSGEFYVRELPVRAHTKFIESYKGLFIGLLDYLLPPEKIFREHTGVRSFERRYGLKYSEPQIRIRILDDALADQYFSGLSDFSLCESDFAKLRLPLKNVVIMENKTNYSNILNFLSLPHLRQTIAVFGSGFRVWLLKSASWLRDMNVYYWGDIDVQGLQILSQLRGYHPDVKAFLMDFETLKAFKDHWTEGTETSVAQPEHLSEEEKKLFEFLRDKNIRLEQEKIRHEYVVKELRRVIV
jgi:hypothetical protein